VWGVPPRMCPLGDFTPGSPAGSRSVA
jgi:hypothetical protein